MPRPSLRPLLEQRKSELQKEIAIAAKAGQDALMLAKSDEFRALAVALARFEDADREAAGLLTLLSQGGAPRRAVSGSRGAASTTRTLGARVRAEFIDLAAKAGLPLTLERGSIYRSPRGRRVGTAVATERHKNRWFLGLGIDSFDSAVLLCVPDVGATMAICLSRSFFLKHGSDLSTSGGQVKFNVARRGADLILKIPRRTPERMNELVSAFGELEK